MPLQIGMSGVYTYAIYKSKVVSIDNTTPCQPKQLRGGGTAHFQQVNGGFKEMHPVKFTQSLHLRKVTAAFIVGLVSRGINVLSSSVGIRLVQVFAEKKIKKKTPSKSRGVK